MNVFTAYCPYCSFTASSPTASVDAAIHTALTMHPVVVAREAMPTPRERWHSKEAPTT